MRRVCFPLGRFRVVRSLVLLSSLAPAAVLANTLPTYGVSINQGIAGSFERWAATADFNCDGLPDVVRLGDGAAVAILVANGAGGFANGTSQVVSGTPPTVQSIHKVLVADFNGDGRADIFIADTGTDSYPYAGAQNTLMLSTSDCHLANGTAGLPQQQDATYTAAAADIDGDGDIDLFIGNNALGAPSIPPQIWLNDGVGHFSMSAGALPGGLTALAASSSYTASEFADVNGDGFADLVLGPEDRTTNSVVLLNDGLGRFSSLANAIPAKPFAATNFVKDIKAADLNHDARPDLIFSVRINYPLDGQWLQILINNGDGTFRDETSTRLPQTTNTLTSFAEVQLVDIDGDGNIDLLGRVPHQGGGDHLFALGDANGFFTTVSLVPGGLDGGFAFVDVNGNGHRDFLSFRSGAWLVPNNSAVLPPGVPQHVAARSMSDRVRLSWPYVWGATSYEVWRSASAGFAGSIIGNTTATRFDDLGATTGVMYYSVKAINGASSSSTSGAAPGKLASPPEATTLAATGVAVSSATVNGSVRPNGSSTTALFQYGPTTAYGSQVTISPSPGSGTSLVSISAGLSGLSCNTTYHFRAVAISAGGTTNGSDLSFTTPVCPPPTEGPLRPFGVWEDFAWDSAGELDQIIDRLVAAGVQNVRMGFRWYMIEPTNNTWSFGIHDSIVSKLRAKNIQILGLLQHTPAWAANGNTNGITPPASDADWQDFVSHVAARYKGQVMGWEVWNEENLPIFWTGDVVRYSQLLKAAFPAIRNADPAALVVLGGIAGNGVYEYSGAPTKQDYLQKLYDNGCRDFFDVVAIHPYVHPTTLGFGTLQTFVQGTRSVMAANGDAAKPLWLTEIGWTVATDYVPPITEADQSNWLAAVYNGRASLGASKIFWYEAHELYPPPTDEGWGLMRHDLSLRPSYYTYQRLTSSAPPAGTRADFNGDGKTDILWRNIGGEVAIWLMNGTAITGGGSVGTVDLAWSIAGTGDYNGDGKSDLLWRRISGEISMWLMNGNTIIGSGAFGAINPAWQILGAGDHNGDGKSDILWRNVTTGEVAIWLMNGATIAGGGSVGPVDNSWSIVGSSDYNGDNKADLLWRQNTGAISMWLMNGNSVTTGIGMGVIDPAWQIVASADFNGDGKADIFWRHTSGALAAWLMNGGTILSGGGSGGIDSTWQIAGTGDRNGDGKADLLWRQDAGAVVIWFMNGITASSGGSVGTINPTWQIVAVR